MTVVTLDPNWLDASLTLSNGNLTATETSGTADNQYLITESTSPIPASTKTYLEVTLNHFTNDSNPFQVGCGPFHTALDTLIGNVTGTFGWRQDTGPDNFLYVNNSGFLSMPVFSQGNVLGMAFDLTANMNFWGRIGSGVWNNSGTNNPTTNTGGFSISVLTGSLYFVAALSGDSPATAGQQITVNFGATAFANSAPSGFSGFSQAPAASTLLGAQACLRITREGKRLWREWLKVKRPIIYLPRKLVPP